MPQSEHQINFFGLNPFLGRQLRPQSRLCGLPFRAGTNVQGVILCKQPRILDIAARGGRFCEKVPEHIVDEVIARLQTLLD